MEYISVIPNQEVDLINSIIEPLVTAIRQEWNISYFLEIDMNTKSVSFPIIGNIYQFDELLVKQGYDTAFREGETLKHGFVTLGKNIRIEVYATKEFEYKVTVFARF